MLFGEAPANRTAQWQSGPNTRSSMSILSSCLVTLGLCIWTSVHLNIPGYKENKPRKWWDPRGWLSKQNWRKVAWLLVGMLAPEMITFTAYWQWQLARQLTKDMIPLVGDNQTTEAATSTGDNDVELGRRPISRRRHPWTSIHSFYATMGGFVVDSASLPEDEKFLPDGHERMVIGIETLKQLARENPQAIPDLSTGEIWDKSKANGLAKAIVCTQASWFIIQCVTRMSQQLPISILELNTLAHCICTMLTYAFWWHKPLDIEQPSRVLGREVYCFCSATFVHTYEKTLHRWTEIQILRDDTDDTEKMLGWRWPESQIPDRIDPNETSGTLYRGQRIHNFMFWSCCCYEKHRPARGILAHGRHSLTYRPRDNRRWALASGYLGKIEEPYLGRSTKKEWMFLQDRISDVPHASKEIILIPIVTSWRASLRTKHLDIVPAFMLAGAVYGGLHLTAWDAPFMSASQATLWRLSGLTVAFAGPWFLLDSAIIGSLIDLTQSWPDDFATLVNLICLVPAVGARALYVLARIYLVIESFISFAYLPHSVFLEP